MKARTILEMLTLGSNLYFLSKDKEIMEKLEKFYDAGKGKVNDLMEESAGEEGEEKLFDTIVKKARQAEKELEHKIEEFAVKAYEKMRIAHTDEIKKLQEQVDLLREQVNKLPGSSGINL